MEELVVSIDFEAPGGIPAENGFTQLGASIHRARGGEKIAGFNARPGSGRTAR